MKQLLELPLNLTIVSPAHTPNWDLVSDVVNSCSRIYRSSKQCRSRYESVLIPREEGKVRRGPWHGAQGLREGAACAVLTLGAAAVLVPEAGGPGAVLLGPWKVLCGSCGSRCQVLPPRSSRQSFTVHFAHVKPGLCLPCRGRTAAGLA